MKQTPLKRNTPLHARSQLKRSWMKRTRKPSKKNEPYTKDLREYIKQRDKHCQSCGGEIQQTHHLIPRGRFYAKWYTIDSVHDERNLMGLCTACHDKATDDNAELERLIELQEQRFGPLRKGVEQIDATQRI